jgi:hypothetical protein
VFDGAGLEVKSKFVIKKENEDCGIAANEDAPEGDEGSDPSAAGKSSGGAPADDKTITVIDVVDALRLKEITLDKKSFMAYIKGYLKTIKEKLEESGKGARIEGFQKGATALVKELVSKWDEVQVFTGESENWDGGLAYCYMKDQADEGPTFYFFNDGLKQERF